LVSSWFIARSFSRLSCSAMLGTALITGKQYEEGVQAFALAVRFNPTSSPKQASLGQAYLAAGQEELGEQHLERAMELDPLNLSAAALLIDAYDKSGRPTRSDQLSQKISKLVQPNLAVKNKVENRGKFSGTKKRSSTDHNSPQFHHEFTIKKPRKNARFSKNPFKNTTSAHQEKSAKHPYRESKPALTRLAIRPGIVGNQLHRSRALRRLRSRSREV
jgi:tetratricopeptide (TPR) repeat protein